MAVAGLQTAAVLILLTAKVSSKMTL